MSVLRTREVILIKMGEKEINSTATMNVFAIVTQINISSYQHDAFFSPSEIEFLCSFGACPGTSSIDQAGLKLKDIHLPLFPIAGIKGVCDHRLSDAISISIKCIG